jgi:hypothetical protein
MFKTIGLTTEVLRMRTVKANTSHNRGNWNHLRIIQEIPVQHTRKARIQGTTENSQYWALHMHFGKSKYAKIQHGK